MCVCVNAFNQNNTSWHTVQYGHSHASKVMYILFSVLIIFRSFLCTSNNPALMDWTHRLYTEYTHIQIKILAGYKELGEVLTRRGELHSVDSKVHCNTTLEEFNAKRFLYMHTKHRKASRGRRGER